MKENRLFVHTAKSIFPPNIPLICGECGKALDPTGVPNTYRTHEHSWKIFPQKPEAKQ